jgi:hypothetical protein
MRKKEILPRSNNARETIKDRQRSIGSGLES